MKLRNFGWLLFSVVAAMPAASSEHHAKYGFATPRYTIEMDVAFYDRYAATRLSFASSLDSTRELCYSSDGQVSSACMDRFVGSVAVVTYHVKTAGGETPRLVNLRELVTVVSQSSALPARKPFSMTQQLVGGLGSDLQVFGYDESSLNRGARSGTRRKAQSQWWRRCRQLVYIDDETKPFAVIEWQYTLSRISIVQIYAPPD